MQYYWLIEANIHDSLWISFFSFEMEWIFLLKRNPLKEVMMLSSLDPLSNTGWTSGNLNDWPPGGLKTCCLVKLTASALKAEHLIKPTGSLIAVNPAEWGSYFSQPNLSYFIYLACSFKASLCTRLPGKFTNWIKKRHLALGWFRFPVEIHDHIAPKTNTTLTFSF